MSRKFMRGLAVWLIVVAFLAVQAMPAWAAVDRLYTPPSGWNPNTPSANTFKIAGSAKEFILLDIASNDQSKYFILAKDAYGQRAFDPDNTTKFDPADANNIAYWLNHDFIDASKPGAKLPSELLPHIDYGHVWATEGCRSDSTCPNDYTVTAGIALLSQTEYAKYVAKFGVKDAITGWGWWLRTARGINASSPTYVMGVPLDPNYLGQTHANPANWGGPFVRPALYLKKSFLSKVKLDVASMGDNVKSAILANYTVSQLQGPGSPQYTDNELRQIGFNVQDPIALSEFEAGTDGWTLYLDGASSGSFVSDNSQAYEGNSSGKWTSDFSSGSTYTMLNKSLSTPMDIQTLEFWVKTADFTMLRVRMVDYSGETHQQDVPLKDTPDWQKVSLSSFTAPSNWGGDGNKNYDTPATLISVVAPGSKLKSGLTSGTIRLDGIKAYVKNELAAGNGGFETGIWPEKTGNAILQSDTVHTGSRAAQIIGSSSSEQFVASLIEVDPLKSYGLSYWMKSSTSASQGIKVAVLELDRNGNKTAAAKRVLPAPAGGTGDWTLYSFDLGNLSAATAYVKLYMGLDIHASGDVWFDDVTVTPANESVNVQFGSLGFIFDPQSVTFDVYFNLASGSAKTYSIGYTASGGSGTVSGTVYADVQTGVPAKTSVPVTGLRNGFYQLDVQVKEADRNVKSYSHPFSVMPTYRSQFDDQYSIAGVSTHYDLENRQGSVDTGIIERAGIRFIRDELLWHKTEKQLGVFDFSRHDGWVNDITSRGVQIIGVLDQANTLYNGMQADPNGTKYAPRTKQELDAYVNYVYRAVEHYKGKISMFEIWNEPNIVAFWKPEPNVIDYATLVKATAAAIRKANPDAVIIAGAVANQNGPDYLKNMFEQGVYPYIDAISFHPYIYPYDPDTQYEAKIKGYADTVRPYGGWKDLYVTEVGWPTSTDARGIGEQLQATYLIKHFMMSASAGIKRSAIYDFRNDGLDPAYTEDNFGVIQTDFTAKPALLALRQMNGIVAGASFYGEAELQPGVKAYLWSTNNEPALILWSTSGNQTIDFGSEAIAAADLLGNPLAVAGTNPHRQLAVGADPVYVTGLSSGWVNKVLFANLEKQYDKWLASWQTQLGSAPDAVAQVNALKQYASQQAAGVGTTTNFADIAGKLNLHYAQGESFIELARTNQLDLTKAMTMLYDFHQIGRGWEKLLFGASGLPPLPATLASTEKIADVSRQIQTALQQSSGGSLQFAEEILCHARDWNLRAEQNRLQERAGAALAWDQTALKLASWAEKVAGFEAAESTNLLVQAFPSTLGLIEGETVTLQVYVTNDRTAPFAGQVSVVNTSSGAVVASQNVSIQPQDKGTVEIEFSGSDPSLTDVKNLHVQLLENDKVVRTQTVPVTLKSKVELALLPASAQVQDVKQIRYKVRNVFSAPITGTISVAAPAGWQLVQAQQSFSLPVNGEQVLEFPVATAQEAAFHEYDFRATVKDSQNKSLLEKTLPLSFTVIPKAQSAIDPGRFEGDLSAWSGAYPIYLNPPANPGSETEWKSSNAAAKAFIQWDDGNLYALVQAYDDIQNNTMQGPQIWNGDSVQISIDTLNNKSASYNGDDYEYGFALSGASRQVYAWKTADGKIGGAKPPEWLNVLRNEPDHLTTYVFRIPNSELEPLNLPNGTEFGLNVALNDADILERERFLEFTGGTASSKNPSLYYTWKLVERPDTTPPVTTASVDPQQPDGQNGWHISPLMVSLTASDDLSGVTQTVYGQDGAAAWRNYSAPVTFDRDGTYSLFYKSTDRAGNAEIPKTVSFRIDRNAPGISIAVPAAKTYSDADTWTVQASVYDDVSGVDNGSVIMTLDHKPVQQGSVIALYTLPLGAHEFSVSAADLAGNRTRRTVIFETAPSIDSLKTLIAGFASSGKIDNDGIANSLNKHLEHGNLQSFINEVQAQDGKHIATNAAAYLLRDAQTLMHG